MTTTSADYSPLVRELFEHPRAAGVLTDAEGEVALRAKSRRARREPWPAAHGCACTCESIADV